MKFLTLHGHSRPIKFIKFSEDGKVVYSASSDRHIIQWDTLSGKKLLSFVHSASVNTMAVLKDNSLMFTGDNTGVFYLWDTTTGQLLKKIDHVNLLSIRSIELSSDEAMLLIVYAGRTKDSECSIDIYSVKELINHGTNNKDLKEDENNNSNNNNNNNSNSNKDKSKPDQELTNVDINKLASIVSDSSKGKYVKSKFYNQDSQILSIREDGFVEVVTLSVNNDDNHELVLQEKIHDGIIFDLDIDLSRNIGLTAGRDGTSVSFFVFPFKVLSVFKPTNPTRNLNSCSLCYVEELTTKQIDKDKANHEFLLKLSIENIFELDFSNVSSPEVKKKGIYLAIVAGGQDSRNVTTTNQKEGGFEVMGYDLYSGTLLFSLLTHFGPVNNLAYSKARKMLASGAEDSTVRFYPLDQYQEFMDIK